MEIPKPKVIMLYNQFKGGVDRTDQCTKSYSCQRKTKRWSLASFMNFIDLCVHNSYLMFVHANPKWQENSKRKKPLYLTWLAKELAIDHVKNRQECTKLQQTTKDLIEIFVKDYDTLYKNPKFQTTSCVRCTNKKDLYDCEICKVKVCIDHQHVLNTYACTNCVLLPKVQVRSRKRGRCYICCQKGARGLDKKTSAFCNNCFLNVCINHRTEFKKTVCNECKHKCI